ncbi:MAG: ribosome biogenesis GTPase Der [Desulfobacterales bacterium]|nr:ribosome biogenesis GTPase Der [Desulfobacterales bacterium]
MKSIVALIGRPNVGKSTIFNKITHTKAAIVDNFPGVTRDRIFGSAIWNDREFTLVDTGGFVENDQDKLSKQIRLQLDIAIEEADVIVVVFDAKYGLSPFDKDIVKIVKKINKPVFYMINKVDSNKDENSSSEFYNLGIEKFYTVSGEHGYGIYDFLDDLVDALPEDELLESSNPNMIKLAVIGKPNVGKSSIVNQMLGKNRLIVTDVAGTTRDAIDSICTSHGREYLLIDTAGIRRKSKVSKKIEKFSIIKAFKALERCDIALIVIDANDGITDQDIKIAGYAYEQGCGCIILLNKWDIVNESKKKELINKVKFDAKFLSFAPILSISALTGHRMPQLFKLVERVFNQYTKRMETSSVNKIVEEAVKKNEPSLVRGRRIKIYYTTQVSIKPPTFVFFANYPEAIHFSYERYLINQIRKDAGLGNTPIKLIFRNRKKE